MTKNEAKDVRDGQELMSLNEAVEMLGTTRPTFYRWLKSGKIKGMKMGRQWRFRREEIDRFLKGQEPVFEPPVSTGPLAGRLSELIRQAGQEPPAAEEAGEIPYLVELITRLALCKRATDIHIAPLVAGGGAGEHVMTLRMRADGFLHAVAQADIRLLAPIVERWKRMACCDLHVNNLPQDGRILLSRDGKRIDCRVSFIPSVFGESVTVRILMHDALCALDRIFDEYSPAQREMILRHAGAPDGAIVASGPAGSGKTTLLYALLLRMAGPEFKAMSVENPVEYHLPWVVQTQVNAGAGTSYAHLLRSCLRQDPDAVMIGEIRDREPLLIAQQAVLTGCKVLTCLHAADAAAALSRLAEVSGEPFLACDTTGLIVAQRLLRKLCPECSEAAGPDADELQRAKDMAVRGGIDPESLEDGFRRSVGCRACGGLGYRGRTVMSETLEMSPALDEALKAGAPADELRRIALEEGMVSLAADGIRKAFMGITTLKEVFRVLAM